MNPKYETKGILVGLDGAGKTKILYQLKLGEAVTTIPTIGFNVETIEKENKSITLWDIGGQEKLRPLWQHYLDKMKFVLFVIDSGNSDRLGEAREELKKLMQNALLSSSQAIN